MQQASSKSGTLILGAMAGVVFLFGLMAFLFVLGTGAKTSAGNGLLAKAPPSSAIGETLPKMPTRDFVAQPLALSEKAEFAQALPASFGVLEGGWQLRPFTVQDMWALRFDLEPCKSVQTSHEHCTFANRKNGVGMYVYARGDEKIAVSIQYSRSRVALPHGEVSRTPRVGELHRDVFFRAVPKRSSSAIGTRKGFEINAYRVLESQGAQKPVLHRFRLELEKDGDVNIYIASNTDRETALSVLDVLDPKLVNALTAEPVMSEQDAITSIANREVEFDVLSDADLRIKVAEMTPGKRNGYARGIMKDALTKGRRPEDYEIVYMAQGDVGYVDTLDYLTGRMPKNHPGQKALKQEARRSLPIGTCLQTPHAVYCGKKAEYLRIVHEIRRRNHARADLPTE